MARSYRFVKGEDITVIGNPGLGDEIVLENAISRGVMSSRTVLDGQDYLQLSIAINPGNSGGPVFDSAGRVIGVATLKSTKAEALAFCIPIEDLNAALIRLTCSRTLCVHGETLSPPSGLAAFRMLTGAGALYAIALDIRAGVLAAALGEGTDLLPTEPAQALDEVLTHLEQRQLGRVDHYVSELDADATLASPRGRDYLELASNYKAMKDLYTHPTQPAGSAMRRAPRSLREHLRLISPAEGAWAFRSRVSNWRPSRRPAADPRRMRWPRSCRAMHGRGYARSTLCPAAAGPHGATVRGRSGRLQPRSGSPGKGPGDAAEAPGADGRTHASPPGAPRPLSPHFVETEGFERLRKGPWGGRRFLDQLPPLTDPPFRLAPSAVGRGPRRPSRQSGRSGP